MAFNLPGKILLFGFAVFTCCYLVAVAEITGDDEDITEGKTWDTFMTMLEDKTSLAALEPNYTVTIDCPELKQCTVDPNGDLIWDARFVLYERFTGSEATAGSSIDECLESNTEIEAYRNCMDKVRLEMVQDMIKNFDTYFIDKLNSDCELITTNCANI